MKQNKTWNSKDIALLISMKNARYPLKDMARELNVTVNCISKALSRYHTDYIKITKTNTQNDINNIRSIFYAIDWFNKNHQNSKQHQIYKITTNNYSYGILGNLSLVSILIVINRKRLEKNLLVIPLNNLLLI